ncbi:MAG: filamentous hemagglutinin N-terminal domain-containing protein [Phenylobacterium sp.]|uniref:two-partner secretion domain-containing protein n=1 Tax=Phenylobacterium sp. TaxID=1871053 RepID=UPI001A57C9BD|nr:filamentous hemagglutinin N-terminal domain-containing protein [Phenylobacterium sp.]MBL8773937.1 filamentous hemagglutinin N-terminal domain-containing protein [Phenylobacterium sp.]
MRNQTSRRPLLLGTAAVALLSAASAAALPVLGSPPPQVSAGGAQPTITNPNATTVRVDLNAPRTIIDWTSFNLTSAERAEFLFDQRNWFVLNRVTGSAISIDGRVAASQVVGGPAGGHVWFYSPLGVAFGGNARVDVGGLLATSAAPNVGEFLNPSNINIHYTGSGSGGPVTVAAGAQFNATGTIAFAAPRVTTAAGSTVTVSDQGSALYLAADSFELQFFPTFNNDLTLFTFIIPNRAAGTPITNAMTIAGQTTSGTIYLAAYSRAAVASEMINAPGLLTARSSIAAYGQVTITTGRNVILGQPGPGDNAPVVHHVPGLTTGSARIGEVNADGNVNIILTGVNYDMAPQGDLTATRVRAGQGLVIGGSRVSIPGGVSSGDAGVNARGANIVAGRDLLIPTITAAGDLFFGSRAGATTFDRATSGGNLSILNNQALTGNLLSSVGSLSISAAGSINVAKLSGGAVTLSAGGPINIAALTGSTSATLGSATGIDLGAVTTPTLTATSLVVRLGNVAVSGDALVRAPEVNLTGSFTAANLSIEGSAGSFRLGGDGPTGLTNDELQRIRVTGALNLYAGQSVPTPGNPNPAYGDFTVLNATIDTSRIPNLNLFAHSGRAVNITGTLDVTGAGGSLRIGDPANEAWRPTRILLSGALGTAGGDATAGFTNVRGFQSVELNAISDILIGSSRFIDLVDDAPPETIDIARGLPSGVEAQGSEIGRLFLVAGSVRMSAGDRILQQNTGPLGQEGGFYLSGSGVSATAPLLAIAGSPETVDVFGSLAGETGLVSGKQAAFSRRLVVDDAGAAISGAVRVNGCPLGVGCSVSTPAAQFRVEQFQPAAAAAPVDPPLMIPTLPRVDEDERETEPVITGSGNEEIWRKDPQ